MEILLNILVVLKHSQYSSEFLETEKIPVFIF